MSGILQFIRATFPGWIDDNGVTSWIDDNGVTSGIDDNGITG